MLSDRLLHFSVSTIQNLAFHPYQNPSQRTKNREQQGAWFSDLIIGIRYFIKNCIFIAVL